MIEIIRQQFSTNIDRVHNLTDIYQKQSTSGRGRASVQGSDILRAAVVLLHASLEDLLRTVAEHRLPLADESHLADISLNGKPKFNLGELAAHRGRTVDEVIRDAVQSHYADESFGNVQKVVQFLRRVGLEHVLDAADRTRLAPMMVRRHLIAHRADRNAARGSGHHAARSIQRATVERWIDVVSGFGDRLLRQLEGT